MPPWSPESRHVYAPHTRDSSVCDQTVLTRHSKAIEPGSLFSWASHHVLAWLWLCLHVCHSLIREPVSVYTVSTFYFSLCLNCLYCLYIITSMAGETYCSHSTWTYSKKCVNTDLAWVQEYGSEYWKRQPSTTVVVVVTHALTTNTSIVTHMGQKSKNKRLHSCASECWKTNLILTR